MVGEAPLSVYFTSRGTKRPSPTRRVDHDQESYQPPAKRSKFASSDIRDYVVGGALSALTPAANIANKKKPKEKVKNASKENVRARGASSPRKVTSTNMGSSTRTPLRSHNHNALPTPPSTISPIIRAATPVKPLRRTVESIALITPTSLPRPMKKPGTKSTPSGLTQEKRLVAMMPPFFPIHIPNSFDEVIPSSQTDEKETLPPWHDEIIPSSQSQERDEFMLTPSRTSGQEIVPSSQPHADLDISKDYIYSPSAMRSRRGSTISNSQPDSDHGISAECSRTLEQDDSESYQTVPETQAVLASPFPAFSVPWSKTSIEGNADVPVLSLTQESCTQSDPDFDNIACTFRLQDVVEDGGIPALTQESCTQSDADFDNMTCTFRLEREEVSAQFATQASMTQSDPEFDAMSCRITGDSSQAESEVAEEVLAFMNMFGDGTESYPPDFPQSLRHV